MPKASNLQKGTIVQINNKPYRVKKVEVHSPSARGANTLYKIRFSEIPSNQKLDQTYKGNDFLEEVEFEKRPASFIFKDQDMYTFMDSENYEQHTLSEDNLAEQIQWLEEGLEGIFVLFIDGIALSIELPSSVELEIIETVPVLKSATVTNRTKPATLANGYIVQVPEYLSSGEIIQINTITGEFMSRVKN